MFAKTKSHRAWQEFKQKREISGKTGTLASMPFVGPQKGKFIFPEVSNNPTLWTASCF